MRGVRVCNEKEAPRGRASQHRRPRMEVAACGGGRAAAMTRGWLKAGCIEKILDARQSQNIPAATLLASPTRQKRCVRAGERTGCPLGVLQRSFFQARLLFLS